MSTPSDTRTGRVIEGRPLGEEEVEKGKRLSTAAMSSLEEIAEVIANTLEYGSKKPVAFRLARLLSSRLAPALLG